MRFVKIIFIAFLFITTIASAQPEVKYLDYDWDSIPKLHQLTAEEALLNEVIVKDKRAVELAYENKLMKQYQLTHKIVVVNSDEAIERNNRIYIPLAGSNSILKQKARVINKNGKIKELDESNIKEAYDEEVDATYKYFALEGVEKGSEIEHFYLLKMDPRLSGSTQTFQSEVPRKNVSFELICPSFLVFKTKSFNGFPEMKEAKDALEGRTYLKAELDNLPKIEGEKFAAFDPHKARVMYKISGNKLTMSEHLFSYNDAAQSIYASIYTDTEKSELKKIAKLVKDIPVTEGAPLAQRVHEIEHYLKTNFGVIDASGMDKLSNINEIMTNMVTNETGMIKLFAHVFNALNIKHQLVLTTNRFETKFDEEFESYNFLSEYLIYLPENKSFIAPTSVLGRGDYIPPAWFSNYGLFIWGVQMGDQVTADSRVSYIPSLPSNRTTDSMKVHVDFDEELTQQIKFSKSITGYYAQNFQPYYDFITEEDAKLLTASLAQFLTEDKDNIKRLEIKNEGTENFGKKPFYFEGELESEDYVEKAGKKYMFKLGELIGPQTELYQEEERKFDVENGFNRHYHRNLSFTIPKGYQVNNLETINMDVFKEDGDGERTMAFTSTYKVEGNMVTVFCDEYYKNIIYPVDQFEDFRKVINAAADFNKITLFFAEKE
jgi:hypothetical protein